MLDIASARPLLSGVLLFLGASYAVFGEAAVVSTECLDSPSQAGCPCGDPFGDLVYFKNGTCGKCQPGQYFDQDELECLACTGNLTNLQPNVNQSCGDERAEVPDQNGPAYNYSATIENVTNANGLPVGTETPTEQDKEFRPQPTPGAIIALTVITVIFVVGVVSCVRECVLRKRAIVNPANESSPLTPIKPS